MAVSKNKNNWQRFAKTLTLNVTKELQKTAANAERDLLKIVGDKLYETYTTNVELSYHPRSEAGKAIEAYNNDPYRAHKKKKTYNNTGTFVNSIYVTREDNSVKVMIQDLPYTTDDRPSGGSTTDVYEYLTEGTNGGGYYFHGTGPNKIGGRNYPTPVHPFEEQTMEQMKGFLDSLGEDIKNGKYSGRRYYKKWR